MSATALPDLIALAHCLRRPVRAGWLSEPVAVAALAVAACRADIPGRDFPDLLQDLGAELRQLVSA